jgi:hypothetical protein
MVHARARDLGFNETDGGFPMKRLALASVVSAILVLTIADAPIAAGAAPKPTTITTSLSGEGKKGEKITVKEGTAVTDTATLSGENTSEAEGRIGYTVFSDKECAKVVPNTVEAGGEVTGGGEQASSFPVNLPPGTYYWRASYSGDRNNLASVSKCGSEVETVEAVPPASPKQTKLTTSLIGECHFGECKSGEKLTVKEGESVTDQATLSGENAAKATGRITYAIYTDKQCRRHRVDSIVVDMTYGGGTQPLPPSVKLPRGTYYWQVSYSGDYNNLASHSRCGAEVEKVIA